MSAETLVNQLSHHHSEISLESLLAQVDDYIIKFLSSSPAISDNHSNVAVSTSRYHLDTPGNKVRAKLCLSACLKLGIKYDDMLILSSVAELLHNASLVHDDIQDNDDLRRGQQTVWKKYGADIAICTGDLLISSAYGMLAGFSRVNLIPDLLNAVSDRTAAVIDGQCQDILYKKNPTNCLKTYKDIAKAKSGALLSLPTELALIAANQKQYLAAAKNAAYCFAIGYQMIDDLNDIAKDATDKSGSKSLNIVFVLADAGTSNPVQEALLLANQSLSEAIAIAESLPFSVGDLLIRYAEKLQGQIYDASNR
jgi:geranylgeranyl pyrophosphate synthase